MIDTLKRHEIQVLRRADHTWSEIAALSGVSEKTARRIAAEAPVTSVDNSAERARRQVGRPSKADEYRDVLMAALIEEATLRSVELLHRARQAGYSGGKSAIYALAQTLRIKVVTPLVRFEGLPGEFSQHDFGEVRVHYQNGTEEIVHFFASRLKYSRWAEVTLVADEQVESLVRALVDHVAAFGGIPLVAVSDRPKTVALKWGRDGVVTEWNATFAGVALDLGLGVEVCWPYRPQEKGSVENLVGWVKGSFVKQRRFLDRADLAQQLRDWLLETNTVRPSRATGVPPAERIAEDRARLRPLKIAPADLALRIPVSVSPMGVVMHDGHPYSMPPDAIGLPGTLYLYRARVRIIAGRFSAEHERKFQPGDGSMLPEHRAQHVAAVSGKRARRYLQRQHLIDLGAAALASSPSSPIGGRAPGFRMWSASTRCCKRMAMRTRCRAQAGSRAPQAPAGAERSGASGRGRARRHPLGASEAGHDRRRCRSRWAPQTAAPRQCPSGLAWSDRSRGAGTVVLSRFLDAADDGGDRPSPADAARAADATRALSVSEDDRRFQFHLSVVVAPPDARLRAIA
jgi:transposase